MIRMAKKGIPHTKIIERSSIAIRVTDEMGECVCVRLDDFEILLTIEKAQAMAGQLFAKVRRIQERERLRTQEALPIFSETT